MASVFGRCPPDVLPRGHFRHRSCKTIYSSAMREIGEFFACCSYFVILSSKSLIWVQTVYNLYQQMAKVAISRYQVKHKMGEYKKTQDCETFV